MFEIYPDAKGEWRWRLLADNHQIVADSGEGYTRKEDVYRAIETVAKLALRAPTKERPE